MALLKLEDIRPARAEVKFANHEKPYMLRPITLEDELWLQTEYGGNIQKIFDECRFSDIFRIAFRLLEDKEDFVKRTVEIVNEEGDRGVVEIGGYKLLLAMASGLGDKERVMRALLTTIGISRPIQDTLIAEEVAKAEKKSQAHSTGERSSTLSHLNTDGLPSTSSD